MMNMETILDNGGVKVRDERIDFRDVDADSLLRGGPGDWGIGFTGQWP